MLWTPSCSFTKSANNFGSTYTEAALGTSLTANASANTKGTTTSVLSALSFDCYWLAIGFINGNSSGASRRFLTDIYTDPAGGTTWGSSPLIANLLSNAPSYAAQGGCLWYQFPIYIKSGTSIGAGCAAETGGSTVRILMIACGGPNRPELTKVGRFVRTFGATTASTTGTAVTPGASGTMGSYSASLGTTAEDLWWWQTAVCFNDTTQTAVTYWVDQAVGDASNKILVEQGMIHNDNGTAEQAGFKPGCMPGFFDVASGANVYVRAVCSGTADSNMSAIVYAVGG